MLRTVIWRILIGGLCSMAIPGLLNAQENKPASDVNVVNTPTVNIGNSVGTSVLPRRPFTDSVVGTGYRTIGPGDSGRLGVTSITFTNLTGTAQAVFVFAPLFQPGSACGSSNVVGGASPRFYVVVPSNQTVHLTYPSPMVFTGINGQSCVAFSGGDNLDITVNGFIN
jgi:hypothetical protein